MPHCWSRRQVVQGAGVVGLGLPAGCGRLPGQAQPRVYRLGRLAEGSAQQVGTVPYWEALSQGLRELGYVEGQNLVWEYAFGDGQFERLPELATALVQRQVDVIVVTGHQAARAARQATSSIPIVVPIHGDPVGDGLVASLARPSGNVTGLSSMSPDMSAKRLQLLKDTVPGVGRVAVLWNGADSVKASDFRETEAAAQALGLTIQSLPVQQATDLDGAVALAGHERADAMIVLGDRLTATHHRRIVELAASGRLPVLYEPREGAIAGALMSYGPNVSSLHYRAATYIDKILKGAKPADLPIEQPMRFDFLVNLKTAEALGLTIPHHVLLQATEVIQ